MIYLSKCIDFSVDVGWERERERERERRKMEREGERKKGGKRDINGVEGEKGKIDI